MLLRNALNTSIQVKFGMRGKKDEKREKENSEIKNNNLLQYAGIVIDFKNGNKREKKKFKMK